MKHTADPGPFCEILALLALIMVATATLLVVIEVCRANYNPADGEIRLMHDWPFERD